MSPSGIVPCHLDGYVLMESALLAPILSNEMGWCTLNAASEALCLSCAGNTLMVLIARKGCSKMWRSWPLMLGHSCMHAGLLLLAAI